MTKTLIEHIVKHLAQKPEAVHVTEQFENQKMIYKIDVDQVDLKHIIGKDGRIIKAIKSLVYATSSPGDKEITVNTAQ